MAQSERRPTVETTTHDPVTHTPAQEECLEQDRLSDLHTLKQEKTESVSKVQDMETTDTIVEESIQHDLLQQESDEGDSFLKTEQYQEVEEASAHSGPNEDASGINHGVSAVDASWEDEPFDSSPHNIPYCGADTSAGTSIGDYFMQRDGVCLYSTEVVSGNNSSFPEAPFPPTDHRLVSQSHTSVFKADRFLVCKYCGKHFPHASALVLHQRVHTGEKPYYCALCGKRFSQASSLKKHYGMHRGEKPFSCLHCGKLFSDQSNLKKHVNVHTGEKPYGCVQCGKTFNQSSNLKTHMKIHTREKPFSCEHCGQIFAYKSSLVKHQQRNCLTLQNPLTSLPSTLPQF